jgi:hypothetical protein
VAVGYLATVAQWAYANRGDRMTPGKLIVKRFSDNSEYAGLVEYLFSRWEAEMKKSKENGQKPDFSHFSTAVANAEIALRKLRGKKVSDRLRKKILALCQEYAVTPLYDISGPPIFSPTFVSLSPDQTLLAVVGKNGEIKLFKPDKMTELITLYGHSKEVMGLAWNVKELLLASVAKSGEIVIWDVEKCEICYRYDRRDNFIKKKKWYEDGIQVIGFNWSEDGSSLFSIIYDKKSHQHIIIRIKNNDDNWMAERRGLSVNHILDEYHSDIELNSYPTVASSPSDRYIAFPIRVKYPKNTSLSYSIPIIYDWEEDTIQEREPRSDITAVIKTDEGVMFVNSESAHYYSWEGYRLFEVPYSNFGTFFFNPNLDTEVHWDQENIIQINQILTKNKMSFSMEDGDIDFSKDETLFRTKIDLSSGTLCRTKNLYPREQVPIIPYRDDFTFILGGNSGLLAYRITDKSHNNDLVVTVLKLVCNTHPSVIYPYPPYSDNLGWGKPEKSVYRTIEHDDYILLFYKVEGSWEDIKKDKEEDVLRNSLTISQMELDGAISSLWRILTVYPIQSSIQYKNSWS